LQVNSALLILTTRIELHGQHQDDTLLIDEFIDAGNKVLAVTGGLELYGKAPDTVWTRLGAEVDTGDTQMTVLSASGWGVGDELAIGPSGMIPN
jgi:hypothetical protein